MEKKRKKKVKKSIKKKTSRKSSKETRLNELKIFDHLDKREQILVSNFVALQKVMTNLSLKLDEMSSKLSKLLDVFEISAKALAEKNFEFSPEKNNEEMLKKIDNLSEQNKIIARGLTMLHENNEDIYQPRPIKQNNPIPKPINPNMSQTYKSSFTPSSNEYEKKSQFPQINPPKPLPQNPDLESATKGYKSTTLGNEDIERPSPPTEDNYSQEQK